MNTMFNTLILIVDQDVSFSNIAKAFLEEEGFNNVKIVNNCQQALNHCQNETSFLIITEYQLSNLNSKDFIDVIKETCKEPRYIVLSGSNKVSDSFKSIENGALSYVKKDNIWKNRLLESVTGWLTYYTTLETRTKDFNIRLQNITV